MTVHYIHRQYSVYLLLLLVCSYNLYCQDITGKIIDKETQEPIPYVSIILNETDGGISNDEGDFSITIPRHTLKNDSVYFSSIGYKTKAILIQKLKNIIITLAPEVLELSSVYLSGEKLTADEIIDKLKDNIVKNYNTNSTKNRFFMRESFRQYYKKLTFDFKKSTIKGISKKLIDSMVNSIPKRTAYHNETLGDYYSNFERNYKKLHIIKTSKSYNVNQEVSFEELQNKFMQVLNDNVKQTSYLKVKSGFFGTKIGVDSIVNSAKNFDKIEREYEQKNYFNSRKKSIETLTNNVFYDDDSEINVIRSSNRYNFTKKDYTYIDGELVYIIEFSPKRYKDLTGTLYVNTEDFAVMRLDYKNANPIYDKIFNMFGVNFNHVKYHGTMIFFKFEGNTHYSLKYLSHENGRSLLLNRPLTIIEKNKHVKGRRKQNELRLQMHFDIIDRVKRELIIFTETATTPEEFISIKDNKFVDVKYFSSYNADFWKGYNIIEPNKAIKEFTAIK
ncbi:MAG: hypothetical protein COA88_12170 [Kordia sp.]|nr:MAG: hypothetical protein COA88_12170 [Kordia sp.]